MAFSLLVVFAGGALVSLAASSSRSKVPRLSCPSDVNGSTVVPATADEVIAAADRVVLDHITETNMGRVTRRTRVNFPVLKVVLLMTTPPLAGTAALKRIAVRRCGRQDALWAWAVVYTDAESPVCCIRYAVFVVRVKGGWRVF